MLLVQHFAEAANGVTESIIMVVTRTGHRGGVGQPALSDAYTASQRLQVARHK